MRYLSLFSGIEACTVAWEPLGWEAVAFAEYEDFPKAVLAHRFPDVPDLGDVTKITEEHLKPLGKIDVVVGGTPCQNLSVAGNRKGLKGEASSLFFEFVRIFELARQYNEARYLLWENVPGAFSTHGGHDFRVVLELLAGGSFSIPEDGWKNSGVALGPNGLTEWRVLDAQYFGVPQRRRRIFALLDTGDWWSRTPILFEQKGSRGDSQKSRDKGENPTSRAGQSVKSYSIQGSMIGRKDENGPQGDGVNEDLSFTLNTTDRHAVAFAVRTDQTGSNGLGVTEGKAHTLETGQGQAVVYENHAKDARITECEEVAPTATSRWGTGGNNVPLVMDKSFTPIFPEKTGTLMARDAKGPGHHDTLSRLVVEDKTFTLSTVDNMRGTHEEHTVYAIDSLSSNSMKPKNPHSGFHKVDIARTLDTSIPCPSKNQGGNIVVEEIGAPIVMGSSQAKGSIAVDQSPTLTTMNERPLVAVKEEVRSVVRRLTPIECERLQGFPDDFTNIPWNGKETSPDSRRYKALGNSMAVPVMRWIAERIQGAKPVVYDEYAISIALLPPLTEEEIELGQQSLF